MQMFSEKKQHSNFLSIPVVPEIQDSAKENNWSANGTVNIKHGIAAALLRYKSQQKQHN